MFLINSKNFVTGIERKLTSYFQFLKYGILNSSDLSDITIQMERLLTIQAILGFDSEITSDLASSCLDMEDSKLTNFLVPLFRTLDTLRSLFNIIM
ncbi:unnamed protein product [Rhizophagus irregularis]|nr:unnamed protein product [Rhizophagus irregularis]